MAVRRGECAANRFIMTDQKAVYSGPQHWCTGCGHCVVVSPQDAICYEGEARAQELPDELPGYEDIRSLLFSKRTVRRYQKRDVPRETIDQVLSVMRYAPSGHNAQPCEYVIVKDPEVKKMMADAVIRSFQSFILPAFCMASGSGLRYDTGIAYRKERYGRPQYLPQTPPRGGPHIF